MNNKHLNVLKITGGINAQKVVVIVENLLYLDVFIYLLILIQLKID